MEPDPRRVIEEAIRDGMLLRSEFLLACTIINQHGVGVFRCFLIQRKLLWVEYQIRQQVGLRLQWPTQ